VADSLLERIFAALQGLPTGQSVLSDADNSFTVGALRQEVEHLAQRLQQHQTKVLALLADNGTAWVCADLAALHAGIVQLPLPGFFSDDQLRHALQSSTADVLLTDQAARIKGLDLGFVEVSQWNGLTLLQRVISTPTASTPALLPPGTAKISFTSGSSGQPKGVCLSAAGLLDTAEAVCAALADVPITRHLSVLPLALLLENVAGVYAPLLRGAEVVLPKLADLGWRGMGGFDPLQLMRQIEAVQPSSLILVPELLKACTLALQRSNQHAPASIQFVAVGGARCDPGLIQAARNSGVPVYEGYGMTECGSVISLNRPGADLLGSVGQPLRHVRIEIDADREIRIRSRAFLGYLGITADQAAGKDMELAEFTSGDLGQRDSDGFLQLSGRRSNLIITAYGRNIAPEWVEAALLAQPEIAQAIVTGEARPWLAALLVPQREVDLAAAVARANATLPDYARIGEWLTCAPFTPGNGLATGNGRPVRAAILRQHADTLASLYTVKESAHVVL
jgi:long-subunit acyl-CoA synthetase (AMP-forming)